MLLTTKFMQISLEGQPGAYSKHHKSVLSTMITVTCAFLSMKEAN